jgi:hypothetical protein
MKSALAGITVLIGLSGAALCQNKTPTPGNSVVHPGTALLDSLGIVAGAPDPVPEKDAQADAGNMLVRAAPATEKP